MLRYSLSLMVSLCVLACNAHGADTTGAPEPKTDLSIYGQGVRATEWRSPQDEQAGFHLPPGFEVRLFASEPQIAKPLNMAFDAAGRMWVTNTVEYPYPAKDDAAARDKVTILTDTNGDGHADEATTFAEGLNIPMGILPYGDGCLCFSIPNLLYLRDTDGDGKCDKQEVVLGPFDTTRDTHGMINALRDGGDGWIYACHGFNNQSEVAGTDGHVVTMHSGNTFRFRPDGSRVEHVTHGQVNPFGMTEDDWGYRYSADCHSKPITQLIFGACYPSFGRPHDGLGFLPPMVDHLHGSTAISGIVYFPPHSAIEPLRGQFLSGNVMTSRLNRNELSYHGATAKGTELSDFLTSDDPWFRPVDLRFGPSGHIYVADFYNKIIGHYEVPLDHPQRDRNSGRIWQIRYNNAKSDEATSRSSDDAVAGDVEAPSQARVASMRQLMRSEKLTDDLLIQLLSDKSDRVRVAALHLAAERIADSSRSEEIRDLARTSLANANAHVVRGAAEFLGRCGTSSDIAALRDQLGKADTDDDVLRQTIRIAIRNLLRSAEAGDPIWSIEPDAELVTVLLGLSRTEGAAMILRYLSKSDDAVGIDALLAHAARNAGSDSLAECVELARKLTANSRPKQYALLDVLSESQNARPGNVPTPLRRWALDLVNEDLAMTDSSETLIAWTSDDGKRWPRQPRRRSGGGNVMLVSSFGRGEKYVGRLVSDSFPAPDQITFWLAGHNGFPDQPDHGKNRVRLVLVESGEVLHEATPARNDAARQIRWDTGDAENQLVRIECIDGDSGRAYAWIAFGDFAPQWIGDSAAANALERSLNRIERLGLVETSGSLETLLEKSRISRRLRLDLAHSIASLRNQPEVAVVLQFLQTTDAPTSEVNAAINALLDEDESAIGESAKLLCKRLSASQQRDMALAWSTRGGNLDRLIEMTGMGWISPAVFLDATVAQAIAPKISPQQIKTVQDLTKDLDVASGQSQLLSQLQQTVKGHGGDLDMGRGLYQKHCAACHQLRGTGEVVGPQLDGAVSRSVERLLEDIITPDRNIDEAFRTTSFLLDDGRVLVGLVTAETPKEITIVESSGKPVRLDPETIELRRRSGRSLMPNNMAEVLTEQQFNDLIQFIKGS